MKVAILISGEGSNMQAIMDAKLDIDICVVVGTFPASGLAIAKAANINIEVIDHMVFPTRELFDQVLLDKLQPYKPDLIILAGFMRVLTPVFIKQYKGRILNIHPSLLPKYPGLDTHQRVLDAGDEEHGCTVHYVTKELDKGPIIAQSRVPIMPEDTVETLAARVLEAEHKLYPEVIKELSAINNNMANVTINLTKWYHFVVAAVPLVAMIATALMWVDTRYMHREISDIRFIELQIRIIEGHVKDYNRIIDTNGTLSAEDQMNREMDIDQLKNLMFERNKILGIGDLPQ